MNEMGFPWYDSVWLSSFVRAKTLVSERYPARVEAFLQAFEVLRTAPEFAPTVLTGVFDENVRQRLRVVIQGLRPDQHEKHEALSFGRTIVHDHPYMVELQRMLVERVSDVVGEQVDPSYNFLSLYNSLGQCEPHLDAPDAKWTLDYCIEQSGPWPIHFAQVQPWPDRPWGGRDWAERIVADPEKHFSAHTLQPGQAVVFSGSSQWHYREQIPKVARKNFCHLAFFHFIPRGTQALVRPDCWAEMFGIREIAQVIVRPRASDPQRLG